jgi:hypothetical protein
MKAARPFALGFGLAAIAAGCAQAPLGVATPGNPFGVPSQIGIPLPQSATAHSASYRVASADTPSLGATLQTNLAIATSTTATINTILSNCARAGLVPGRSYTFADPGTPGGQVTVLLTVLTDHAVLSIGKGTSATGSTQMISISYTKPSKGTAVFHAEHDPAMGRLYVTETYDADAGYASIDAMQDATAVADANSQQKAIAHWDLIRHDASASAGATFTLKVAANLVKPQHPSDNGQVSLTANFLADGSAAAVVGLSNAGTGNQFKLVPNDGLSWNDPNAGHDLYLSASGQDVTRAQASAQLRAIAPTGSDLVQPATNDPVQTNAFAGAQFQFPLIGASVAASASTSLSL